VLRVRRYQWPLGFLCAAAALAPAIAPAAWAENCLKAYALIAHSGRYPASVGSDDPALSTVGIVYPAHLANDADGPGIGEYATAFLISDCYALTSRVAIETIAPHAGQLIFRLVVNGGENANVSTVRAWQSTVIVGGQSENPTWALLRLENCQRDDPASPARQDPFAIAVGTEDRSVRKTRQLGILTTQSLTQPHANISASAWSMVGGPLQMFDAGRGQWTTIGLAVAPDPDRAGNPASSGATSNLHVGAVDDGSTAFFRLEPQILPLNEIWGPIDKAIERDLMLRTTQGQADRSPPWDGKPRS
jgi:hypothetical protein